MRAWVAVGFAALAAACGDNSEPVIALENPSPHLMDFYGERIVPLGARFLVASPSASVDGFEDAGLVELRDSLGGDLIQRYGTDGPATTRRYGGSIAVVGTRFALGNWQAGTVSFFDVETGKLVDEYQAGTGATVELSTAGSWFVVRAERADHTATVRLIAEDGTRSPALASNEPGDLFGKDVIATTNRIVICAPYATVDGLPKAGAAYIYDRSGVLQRKLTATVPTADSYFAEHLATLGDHFALEDLIGETVIFDEAGERVGAVPAVGDMISIGSDLVIARPYREAGDLFVVDGATANVRVHLDNPDAAGQLFGFVTVLEDGAFVVTSSLEQVDAMPYSGRAYLYDPAATALHELVPPARHENDEFGTGVAATGSMLAVSAPRYGGTGRVFLYSRDAGDFLGELEDPEPDTDDGFGGNVVPFADGLAVSAVGDPVAGNVGAGTVYLFPSLSVAQ